MEYSQLSVPKLSRANRYIIGTLVGIFILDSILKSSAGMSITGLFGLVPVRFFGGHIYQMITYPLVSKGLLEVVFNAMIVWFIGSELETLWGRKKYLSFMASAIITAAVIYLFVSFFFLSGSPVYNFPLGGFAGVASALCVGYAILFPDKIFTFMLIFPMKAKYFCMILIGMQLYQGFFSPNGAQAWGHLGAILGGYLYMLVISHPATKNIIGGGGHQGRRKRTKLERSHLKIVKDDDKKDEDPPVYH